MEERKLNEKESIEIITDMISRTKQRYIGNGSIFLMWGYLVTGVTLLIWILLVTTRQQIWNWLWFAIPIIGCTTTPFMTRKLKYKSGVITYTDKVTSTLWRIMGISEIILTFVCLGFYLIGGVQCWVAMLVYALISVPLVEMAQGIIVKEKCLVYGGIIGLAVGFLTVCCVTGGITLGVNWYLPLIIVAFIAIMIVPGYVMSYKRKNI